MAWDGKNAHNRYKQGEMHRKFNPFNCGVTKTQKSTYTNSEHRQNNNIVTKSH